MCDSVRAAIIPIAEWGVLVVGNERLLCIQLLVELWRWRFFPLVAHERSRDYGDQQLRGDDENNALPKAHIVVE